MLLDQWIAYNVIICDNFAFYISQCSAATCLRYGLSYYGVVGNLVLFPVLKEFFKSVKISQSSHQSWATNFKGAVFLRHTVEMRRTGSISRRRYLQGLAVSAAGDALAALTAVTDVLYRFEHFRAAVANSLSSCWSWVFCVFRYHPLSCCGHKWQDVFLIPKWGCPTVT